MTTQLDDALIMVLTDHETGNLRAESVVSWAVAALAQGRDSPSLRILAGLSSTTSRSEAEPYFQRTLDELHVQAPTKHDLLFSYLRIVARAFLNGAMPAEQAAELIHSRVVSPLNHPPEVQRWCYLWEGLDPDDFHSLEGDERKAAVEAEARRWA